MTTGAPTVAVFKRLTRTIPIVFTFVTDPVRDGLVETLAHPGGNITGFTIFEHTMAGKWVEMLKEVAPGVTRVAVMQNPEHPAWTTYLSAITGVASSAGVAVTPLPVRDADEIRRAIADFVDAPNGGLIVLPSGVAAFYRDLIVAATGRHRLPAIFPERIFAEAGGLISYGVVLSEMYRQAARYADRILRGAKPSELPVQAATKFELIVNLKTAKALGLDMPADAARPRRRGDRMIRRREFIAFLGGGAATWPLTARAQQPRLPTIGYLGATASSASEEGPRLAVLVQRLKELGWIEGRTVGIEYRWAGGHGERFTDFAAEFTG